MKLGTRKVRLKICIYTKFNIIHNKLSQTKTKFIHNVTKYTTNGLAYKILVLIQSAIIKRSDKPVYLCSLARKQKAH